MLCLNSCSPCAAVRLSGRKLLSSSCVWFQILDQRLKQEHNRTGSPHQYVGPQCQRVLLQLKSLGLVGLLVTHLRADVVLKQPGHQFVGGLLEQNHHRLIQRVSVLVQPAGDVVRNLQ